MSTPSLSIWSRPRVASVLIAGALLAAGVSTLAGTPTARPAVAASPAVPTTNPTGKPSPLVPMTPEQLRRSTHPVRHPRAAATTGAATLPGVIH